MPDLGSTISLNASNFAAGVAQTRAKLVELNTALIENRNKMKEVNKEAQELQKQEKALTDAMKDGGTKEQQQELEQLRTRIGQVNSELGTLRTREQEIQSDIRKTSNELKEQKNDTNNLTTATDGATAAIKKLETGLKAVLASAAGKKLYEVLIGSNAEMEQYLTSFEVMLGDARKAKDLMSELNTMAAKTPMELTDVVKNGTLLMNYGVDSDKLIETMTKLGDLAAGNAQKFERVSLAYGQMLAKGKVSGEELRQMTEAGVPLLQALAEEIGVTSGEMQDLVSKGKIGIPELNAAIESMTTGTGQFAGMMEKQSQTFSGMLSTLSDEAQQFGRDLGEKAFDVAKESLSELLELIEEWRADGTLDELSEDVGETIGNIATVAKDLLKFLVDNKETVIGAAQAFIALKGAMAIKDAASTAIGTIQGVTKAISAMGPAALATTAQIAGLAGVLVAVGAETVYYIDKIAGLSDEVESTQRSVQRLTDRMEESVSANEAEMNILQTKAAEYENLRNTQDRSASQEERLKTLAGELQGVLGDEVEVVNSLTGEYNDLSAAVENYVEQQSKKVKFTALEDAAKEAYQKMAEIERKMEERREESAKYHESFHILDWNGAVETNSFINDMAAYREELAKCQKIIDEYNAAVEEGAYQTAEASAAVDEATQKAAELSEELARAEERTKTLNDLADATKNLVSEYSTLTEAYQKLQNGEALNFQQMQALISVYPELAKHIQVTADGYTIEVDALAGLNNALLDGANAQIEAENAKTRAAIEGARERIRLYQKEAEAAGMYEHDGQKVLAIGHKISEEAAYIEQLEAQLAVNKSLPQYFQSNQGKSTSSSSSSKATTTTKEKEPPGLKSLMSYAKTTSAAFKEMNDNGELALSTVQALIDAGYESALEYNKETGKWTISAKAYENAANEQITAAQGVEGATQNELAALESLRKKLSEVEAGTYGVSKATKYLSSSEADSDMSMLSEAFSEQKSNKTLSFKTADKLKGTKYAKALEFTEEGAIKLKPELVTDDLQKEIDSSIEELKKQKKTAKAEDIFGIEAEIKLLEKLKKEIKDVTSGTYGENSLISDARMKDLEAEQKKQLKVIDDELKAKQKLRDETLKAIDDEVKARQKLTEDNDIQKQIDQVMAQLRYSQLDEFSRAQLGRKLQSLENEKADMLWKRDVESRRESANSEYDTAEERLNDEKERINNALDVLKELNNTFDTGMKDLGDKIKAAIEELDPGSTMHLTFNNTSNLSESQIVKLVADHFGIDAIQ